MRRRPPWFAVVAAVVMLARGIDAAAPTSDASSPFVEAGATDGDGADAPVDGRAMPSAVRWWTNPLFVQQLALTAPQQEALDRAAAEGQRRRLEATARLGAARTRLAEILGTPRVERRALEAAVAAVVAEQANQLRAFVHVRDHARRILTVPQLERLLALHPGIMARRWEEGPARRPRARVKKP